MDSWLYARRRKSPFVKAEMLAAPNECIHDVRPHFLFGGLGPDYGHSPNDNNSNGRMSG